MSKNPSTASSPASSTDDHGRMSGSPATMSAPGYAELHMAPMTPDLAVAGAGFHAGHCACDDCMLLWAVTGSGNKRRPLLPLRTAACEVVFYAPALGTPDQPERVRGLFRCGRPMPCPVHSEDNADE